MDEIADKILQFQRDIDQIITDRTNYVTNLFKGKIIRIKENNRLVSVYNVGNVDKNYTTLYYRYVSGSSVETDIYVVHFCSLSEEVEFALPVEWNILVDNIVNHYNEYKIKDINFDSV